jgi:hypothetical protein
MTLKLVNHHDDDHHHHHDGMMVVATTTTSFAPVRGTNKPLGPCQDKDREAKDREACRCLLIRSKRLVGASNSSERLVGASRFEVNQEPLFQTPRHRGTEAPKRLSLLLTGARGLSVPLDQEREACRCLKQQREARQCLEVRG